MIQFQHWHFLYLCPSLLLETIEKFLIRIYQICHNENTWKHGKHVNNNNGNISSIWQLKSVFVFPNTAHFFNIIIWIHCYLQCKIPFDLSFFDESSIRQKKKVYCKEEILGYLYSIARILFPLDKEVFMNMEIFSWKGCRKIK